MRMRLLRFFVLLYIVLAVIFAIRSLNITMPTTASIMLKTGNCSQPCWWGLQPGKTNLQDVDSLLKVHGKVEYYEPLDEFTEYSGCWRVGDDKSWRACVRGDVVYSKTNIQYLYIWPKSDTLRLGDVINILGEPTYAESCLLIDGLVTQISQPIWAIKLEFNTIVVRAYETLGDKLADPEMFVYTLSYFPEDSRYFAARIHNWRGFAQIPEAGACAEVAVP